MGKIKGKGFTLIEVLTVSGIMVLFSITLVAILLGAFRGGGKAQILQQLHEDGDFALKAITREVRRADKIACGAGNLTLTMPYGGTPILYKLLSDRVASGSAFLTGTLGEVSGLTFSCINGSGGNQIVTIKFTLTVGDTSSQVQEKFSQNFATSVATRQK
ncbi:MAG: type II secretion system protein [Candidatus Beckwithbacteria bacterium]|nr:type II secretion system protein [Candidatus Beckwithbacteria bacterium]